jgi:hypothetical protein
MRVAFVSLQLAMLFALSLAYGCGGGSKLPPIQVKPMPEGGSFSGVWFSPQYGEMHVLQTGSSAIGKYTKDERHGRLQGSIEGDVMRFEWTEQRELIAGRAVKTKGHGYFRIVKDDVEESWKLLGEWGNDDAERGGGPWTAVKSKTRKPEIDSDGNARESSGSSSGSNSSGSSGDEGFGGRDVAPDEGSSDLSDL